MDMKLWLPMALLVLAAPALRASAEESAKPDPVAAMVLSDLNEQERWLYGLYTSDPARLKALRIRGGQVDVRDADEKRKFLADTRKKLAAFVEKEYGFNGGEFGMLSAVLSDPAKAAAFRSEAAQTSPADKEAQKALIGRWRKEIVGWAEGYLASKHETDMSAKTVEGMVAPEEKALLEQMRRNDERGFKVGTFTKWIGEANRKMAAGNPAGRKKALELVKMAREGMNENIGKYLALPEIAKLREKPGTALAKAEAPAEGKDPGSRTGKMESAMRELENAAKVSGTAASADSGELMLAGAMTPFSGGDPEGRVVDAAASPSIGRYSASPAAAALDASLAPPIPQKGLRVREVPGPAARAELKGGGEKAKGWLGPGLGAAGLGLIGFAVFGPLGAMIGAALGAAGGFFTQKLF